MRPVGSPEMLERRRKEGIRLLRQGQSQGEVARKLGVDQRSVRRWYGSFRREGMGGVKARPTPGRPPKLDLAQTMRLEQELLKGAQAAGFATDLWTCPRVGQLIAKRFGVRYHVDHINRLLHGLGWTPQKPERRAQERDEEETQRWIKHTWPRIKKKSPG